jgi:hypothetical protein
MVALCNYHPPSSIYDDFTRPSFYCTSSTSTAPAPYDQIFIDDSVMYVSDFVDIVGLLTVHGNVSTAIS